MGHSIGAGDEGGPVFNSKSNAEVAETTSKGTEKVGPCFGIDTVTVSDLVASESH